MAVAPGGGPPSISPLIGADGPGTQLPSVDWYWPARQVEAEAVTVVIGYDNVITAIAVSIRNIVLPLEMLDSDDRG